MISRVDREGREQMPKGRARRGSLFSETLSITNWPGSAAAAASGARSTRRKYPLPAGLLLTTAARWSLVGGNLDLLDFVLHGLHRRFDRDDIADFVADQCLAYR